ncbi:MAG: HAD-IA family hydrolase [Gammaproteobacteria bacterium]|nr:HAD-IA family hydrolase [Gammaproteobacteria bacterium]
MQIQAVLFDLDGTLLDTAPDFILALNALRVEYELSPLPDAPIRNTVSDGARALVSLAFGLSEGEGDFDIYREKLLSNYEQHLGNKSCLFPGMEALLKKLEKKKIPWGIVTNKPSRFTIPLLEALSLNHRCSVLVCADQVSKPKPHPEPLLKACKFIDVAPENSVYIGDHQRDIEAGHNAGMTTIAALFGYIPTTEDPSSWNAHFTANSTHDIHQHLFSE